MTNRVVTWPDLTHPNQAQCQWPSYCFENITCQVCLCITSVHDDLYKCYYFICMYSTLMWCSSKALPICTSNLSKYITTSSCSIYPKVSLWVYITTPWLLPLFHKLSRMSLCKNSYFLNACTIDSRSECCIFVFCSLMSTSVTKYCSAGIVAIF